MAKKSYPLFEPDLFGEPHPPVMVVFGEHEAERTARLRQGVAYQIMEHEEHRQACEVREIRKLHAEKGDAWLYSFLSLVESKRGKAKAEELRQLLSQGMHLRS